MDDLQKVKNRYFNGSQFIGNYEKKGSIFGMLEEQWLWKYKEYIIGNVLDMSTPRYWHEFIHLRSKKVYISDLSNKVTEKMGRESMVDIIHDFCTPYTGDKFDTIICSGILEHCVDPLSMVSVLSNILTPGGFLFIYTPYAYMDGHMDPDYWRFCRQGYSMLLKGTDLKEVHYDRFLDIKEFVRPLIDIDISGVYMVHGFIVKKLTLCI